MTAPWPCSTCGAPGRRNVFARGYCAAHLVELYRKFDAAPFVPLGLGLPIGQIAKDGTADIECRCCGATWSGPALTTCPWCTRRFEAELVWQGELVLTPPDVDLDDRQYDGAMRGWADRLAVAVTAGIVTQAVAERALSRAVARVA